ncbi:MAG: hypothetical protein JWM19_4276 [Actinomycetia bacterium]|nr:hypothetical protein [Actinomycetes bacterium]
MAVLGGLAVFVAEPDGDLLPGGPCCTCSGDELVLAEVEFAALGGDGVERGQGAAGIVAWMRPRAWMEGFASKVIRGPPDPVWCGG